jgi:hypothetical protein
VPAYKQILLEFITISLSYFERGLEIPPLAMLADDYEEEFFMLKTSRYSIIIGDRVLWIVDGSSLEGDLFPWGDSVLPDIKNDLLFCIYARMNTLRSSFLFFSSFCTSTNLLSSKNTFALISAKG